ncbi:hypothetical protein GWK18_10205 [Kocuria sp. JC486]|uniref:hypothetical protein n=1 Tax=Kocuria sp. JC486 TaxID=1970736 RepID=UPI0014249C8D|nr:hypothetical protein [Kocuria sp. JC486]NHU85949.1 hypothetical protein [Kocuria sp. JC486]
MAAPGIGFGQNDGFVFQTRAFLEEVAGLAEDESWPRNATFDDGVHNMQLIAAISRSATEQGREVTIAQ